MAAPVASTSLSAGSVVASASKAKPAGKQLGTLVVVVIKARNLPNKQRIGKQDPYCSIALGHQKQKTPAVKRGGQTPHWDAQLQFEIWEESDDKVPVSTTETGGIGPASAVSSKKDEDLLPGQATVGRVKSKASATDASKRLMKIACYADDPREPELIGETELDYAPTLKKGEFDEWVEIKHKGKYAGEVFIEMTFYSAAPPPVKRKSKPAVLGSGYGGPGQFEPLPDNYPQSPPNPTPYQPSSHLSPIAGHPLRMSQSQYSLNSSTSNRPPSSLPSLDEFGRKRPTPVVFPTPSHTQSESAGSVNASNANYHPPYAPPSLAPSTSSHHPPKHRASFSSYGMTPHDIDSMLRPLSSLSVGGSVNKPLPLPQPDGSIQSYRPMPMPARPQSGQAYAMAPQPTPSPRPHPDSTAVMPQPALHHHHSQSGAHPQATTAYAGPQHAPTPHHRHSMTTYLPDGADAPWNPNQIPSTSGQERPPQEIALHHPPTNDVHIPYNRPSTSWQDPRATSPFPQSPGYGLASPTQAGHHPSALQPGTSPQFTQHSPPPPSRSPLPSEPPVWNSASHYSSPALGEPLQHSAGYSDQFDNLVGFPAHQQQQPSQEADQNYGQGAYTGGSYPAPYQGHQGPQSASVPEAQHSEQHAYAFDQGSQQPHYGAHDQPFQHQQQPYEHGFRDNTYDPSRVPGGGGGYNQPPAPNPLPEQHAYLQQPPLPQNGQLQQDYRLNSPYRPLPQPTPEPAASHFHHQQPPHHQQQQYYSQHSGYEDQPQAPPPRQPRFGLPAHQPYDPPYIPPSSRQSQHYSTPQQPPMHQAPPPIPPVPQELRQDLYGSYGHGGSRY